MTEEIDIDVDLGEAHILASVGGAGKLLALARRFATRAHRAEAEVERLTAINARAWELYQRAGVSREPDGRTGNKRLDELGELLDENANAACQETS